MSSGPASILEIKQVSKYFGGLAANSDVSFSMEEGMILGLIGPNGAGKTTLFNCITGYYPPSKGEVLFKGERMNGLTPDQVCKRGMVRTWQKVRPLAKLTVLDNVVVGALVRTGSVPEAREIAREQLQVVKLSHKADFLAGGLPIGERKKLEVARVLATKPDMLLLDEVMGGLNPAESEEIIQLILDIKKRGLTQMVIEHDMKAIMRISDRIVVLNSGEKLAEVPPRRSSPIPRWSPRTWAKPTSERGTFVLRIENLDFSYGDLQVLWGISLQVSQGEIVTVLGANGAGKSTTLKNVSRLVRPTRGSITFEGKDLCKLESHEVVELGVVQVPEGRRIFPEMTVLENLRMGSFIKSTRPDRQRNIERAFTLFPRLAERQKQLGGTLSGGEQQMLAIGRGLMTNPRLLLLDEPSLGLSPLFVKNIFEIIKEINKQGTTILLVEQNVFQSLRISHRAYVLETGRVVLSGTGEELLGNEHVKKAFLGA